MVKGIIFDLDGVICSTDHYHYLAWKKIADELGVEFDESVNNRLRGVSRMDSLEIVLENYKGALALVEKVVLAEKKNDEYRNYLKEMSPKDLTPEVKGSLDVLRSMGLKLAIGSSSKNTPFILERIGLSDYFDAVSDGNNIEHSKPDPEVFLKAAQMLGLKPEECLVVEDASAGAKAAHAGGMLCACVGDAAALREGDFNMTSFHRLISIADEFCTLQ